ncbi:MAG: hypothetical protein ABSC37_03760 [Xanthobacteraceae bacterium]
MSDSPRWGYVQARLQARHGERLQEADWRAIEAVRSIDQFIERARASSLRRFIEGVDARASSHAVERMLRAAWRVYVAELANWVPAAWCQAVLWTSLFPELPIIDGLLRGEAPDWIQQDPAFAELAQADLQKRNAALANPPFDVLVATGAREKTLAARWYTHWRSLWPHRRAENHALLDLAATINAHVERLDRAGLQETSAPHRRDLALKLTRMFRRHSGSPAALFCHLALVALDLERLRGDLIRRRLFEPSNAKEAA